MTGYLVTVLSFALVLFAFGILWFLIGVGVDVATPRAALVPRPLLSPVIDAISIWRFFASWLLVGAIWALVLGHGWFTDYATWWSRVLGPLLCVLIFLVAVSRFLQVRAVSVEGYRVRSWLLLNVQSLLLLIVGACLVLALAANETIREDVDLWPLALGGVAAFAILVSLLSLRRPLRGDEPERVGWGRGATETHKAAGLVLVLMALGLGVAVSGRPPWDISMIHGYRSYRVGDISLEHPANWVSVDPREGLAGTIPSPYQIDVARFESSNGEASIVLSRQGRDFSDLVDVHELAGEVERTQVPGGVRAIKVRDFGGRFLIVDDGDQVWQVAVDIPPDEHELLRKVVGHVFASVRISI